jgi:hypothetical protein
VQQQIPSGQASLNVSARFGGGAGPITSGLMWRVYPAKPDATRAYRPIKEDRSANPVFSLPSGDYVVHVSFGMASAAKAVSRSFRSPVVSRLNSQPKSGRRYKSGVRSTLDTSRALQPGSTALKHAR